jgi:ankyrin repeat protein
MNINVCRGALAEACDDDNLELVSYLLSQGADPNLICRNYRYPLYDATRKGNLEMLELLLEHGADRTINAGDVFAVACYGGEKVITKLLDMEMSDELEMYRDRCLQEAAYSTKLRLCSWLLEQGANINCSSKKRGSPLQAAVSDDQVYAAAGSNNRRLVIDMLLSRRANVNAPGPKGSALQIALSNRDSKSANTFLDAGADINMFGGELHSPLQAEARHTQKLLPRLLSMGVDVNAVGGRYGTALHAAAYTHDLGSISLLISYGADIQTQAGKYGDVLQAASKENAVCNGGFISERDSVQALKLLHAHGASTTAQGGKYESALQMAAKSGNLEAVKWLLANGADPWVQGGKYGSAMKAAVKKERWGVISYLEQHFPGCG